MFISAKSGKNYTINNLLVLIQDANSFGMASAVSLMDCLNLGRPLQEQAAHALVRSCLHRTFFQQSKELLVNLQHLIYITR